MNEFKGVKIYHCSKEEFYFTNLFHHSIFKSNTLRGLKCKITRYINK